MKKVKKESSYKIWKEKMKSTPKGHALLKLIRWGIFFTILFIFLLIASVIKPTPLNNISSDDKIDNKEETSSTLTPQLSITELQNNLLSATYTYKYDITIENNNYLFEGIKYIDYEEGYLNTNNNIKKYYLDNTGTYYIENNNKVPSDIYQNIASNFLDLKTLFYTINNLGLIKKTECDCLYDVYEAQSNEYQYTINTNSDKTNIEQITISSLTENIKYSLTFNNIVVVSNE